MDPRCIVNLLRMLKDRKIDNTQYTEEVVNINTKLLHFDAGIIVMLTIEPKVGKPHVEKLYSVMVSKNVTHAIIVSRSPINSYGTTAIAGISVQNSRIETFEEKKLTYNLTDHVMQPKFRVCSASERDELFKAYSITSRQLSRMTTNDPVAKYYGLVKGDLLEIHRKSRSYEGVSLSYRIIV